MNFQVTAFNRKTFLYYLENLTPEQLFKIPKGFKNNILWNIAHVLVTEQMLTYALSGLELPIDKKFVKLYAKDTFPTDKVSKEAIEEVKTQLLSVSKQTKIDYENGLFKGFKEYPTSTGIVLKNIDDAMQFNTFHEGLHLGVILSLKKLVK